MKLSRGLAQVIQEAETEIRDFLAQNLFESIQPDSISTVPPPRVGLSSGIVYAGLVGSSQRCEYTVIGPLVNLAARLMGTAQPGEILLPLETYQRMRVPVATHRIEPVQLKGFSKPIETVQLAFDQTLAFHEDVFFYQGKQTELIGREAELEQLLAHARATFSQQPQGHIVTLMGEAGVGKSRLVDAFVTELYARLDAPRVIRETCHNYEQTMPYAVITRLVRQILQVDPHAPDANEYIVRRIHQLIPDQLQLVWLLEGFLNIEFDDDTPVMFLQPDYRREKLHDLIITLLREAAKLESLVLVIEDFAWIDASSYELLQSFNQSLPSFPLLLLCVMRTLPDGWQSTDVITLEDLSDERSRAFMRSMLDGDLPPELEAFVARAGGRPIFLEEIIYYLIQTGMLRRNDQGRWECTGPLDDSIPSQIERLIVARLDKMTVSVRQMINIAAVLGMRMSVALLNEVCRTSGISPEPLEAVLSTLFMVPDPESDVPTIRFKHELLRDVTYNSQLYAQRRTIHHTTAQTIKQVYGDRLDEYQSMLAYHYLWAEEPEQALPLFLQAARQSQERFALGEAKHLYQQALALLPLPAADGTVHQNDRDNAIQIYGGLGDVLALTSEYSAARELYMVLHHMLSGVSTTDALVQQAAVLRKVGTTYEQQGLYEQALSTYHQARRTTTVTGAAGHLEHARILSDIGWTAFRQNNLSDAQHFLEQALHYLHGSNNYVEQARVFNRLGGIAYTRGDTVAAHYYVEQNLHASQETNDLVGQFHAFANLSNMAAQKGNTEKSLLYGLQALDICVRIGNHHLLSRIANNIGVTLYEAERYTEAPHYLEEAVRYARTADDTFHQMLALLNLGRVQTELGHWHAAAEALRESYALACSLELQNEELDGLIAQAELALAQNDLATAEVFYREAQALVVEDETQEYGRFLRLQAWLQYVYGNHTEAVALLARATAIFQLLRYMPEVERTQRLENRLAR
ncbi:MAG: tetratricopeptide repeat protein [Chloroflexaceae bacterium]|nr:tetratricopeptide repeat protein [Chloroflexaceae bacterium]